MAASRQGVKRLAMQAPACFAAVQRQNLCSKSYYETIDGLTYDRAAISAAKEAVAGAGDGRVSKQDAEAILETLLDQGSGTSVITAVESRTAFLLLRDFNFTDEARAIFVAKLATV